MSAEFETWFQIWVTQWQNNGSVYWQHRPLMVFETRNISEAENFKHACEVPEGKVFQWIDRVGGTHPPNATSAKAEIIPFHRSKASAALP